MRFETQKPSRGPLQGVTVLDVSALGPGPFCSMILADFGARVIAVERPGVPAEHDPSQFFSRGKQSIVVDIRNQHGADLIRKLVSGVDVFLESFRPGTMERRGLGPDTLLEINPRLIYTRLTGYGQEGPKSQAAGHDINYLASSGLLGVLGNGEDRPAVPLNVLGDFASGSQPAALGTVMALFERASTGKGQVVDAAMVDGASLLLSAQLAEYSAGLWGGPGTSVLSGNAPFYGVYECADGKLFSVGAIEDRFYSEMLIALDIAEDEVLPRSDTRNWEPLRAQFAAKFRSAPQRYWIDRFTGADGCGAPVLEISELAENPHLNYRRSIFDADGRTQSAPAPRLSRYQPSSAEVVPEKGAHTHEVLESFGFDAERIEQLEGVGAIHQASQPTALK